MFRGVVGVVLFSRLWYLAVVIACRGMLERVLIEEVENEVEWMAQKLGFLLVVSQLLFPLLERAMKRRRPPWVSCS